MSIVEPSALKKTAIFSLLYHVQGLDRFINGSLVLLDSSGSQGCQYITNIYLPWSLDSTPPQKTGFFLKCRPHPHLPSPPLPPFGNPSFEDQKSCDFFVKYLGCVLGDFKLF